MTVDVLIKSVLLKSLKGFTSNSNCSIYVKTNTYVMFSLLRTHCQCY